MSLPDPNVVFFSNFLQLEERARNAETVEALSYSIVNELRRILEYGFAALFELSPDGGEVRAAALSGVAVLDRDVPLIRWLERIVRQVAARAEVAKVHRLDPESFPETERRDWGEWSPPHVLWCPLTTADGHRLGALWLGRDRAWEDSELMMVERIAGCYAHAWKGLTTGGRRRIGQRRLRRSALIAAVLALLALAFPVTQSALAPVEIVATEPQVVASPIDGVVARFLVVPNQTVTAGQPLLELDDTTLRNQAAVAERTLGVAQAELRQAVQGAFADRRQAGQMALLDAQVQLRAAELDYARALLARVVVNAERAGIAVFTDSNDWIGKPVVTGQRILQIADPQLVEARVALPVRDAIALEQGDRIELFLDNDPLGMLTARLVTASFEADQTPAGVTAYRLTAALDLDQAVPRIGLQGTANVHGRSVPLLLYFFKRPITSLRQWLGF